MSTIYRYMTYQAPIKVFHSGVGVWPGRLTFEDYDRAAGLCGSWTLAGANLYVPVKCWLYNLLPPPSPSGDRKLYFRSVLDRMCPNLKEGSHVPTFYGKWNNMDCFYLEYLWHRNF